MIDIQVIRQKPQKIKKACQAKNVDPRIVDKVLKADQQRRELIQRIEELRQEKNKLGSDQKEEGRIIKKSLKKLDPEFRQAEDKFKELLYQIPNLPAKDVKTGKDESENELIKTSGKKPKFNFKPQDHLTLAESLDLVDVKRAAKVSGSRFGYLINQGVLLEFALIQYGLEILTKEGFIPIVPPVLTKASIFNKLGYSQFSSNEDYYLVFDPQKENPSEESNYYLIGTAEHAIVPMHKDEALSEDDLPRRYVGFSTAFRREAGSYGKDVRGIFRVHQFDKLEMVSFIKPQPDSDKKEHEYLLSLEEKIVKRLGLPYQIVKMCTADLGHPTARKFDIECWFPSEKKYRETHSCSTCTDYQSRALNIKYRKKNGETDFVHILNGTGVAIARIILAILENYQQKDGSVKIPKVLQKYVGSKVIRRSSISS